MKISERYILFISDKKTAALSIIVFALAGALYSSAENALPRGGEGIVTFRLSFSTDIVLRMFSSWTDQFAVDRFIKYIRAMMLFYFCAAFSFSTIIAAMWKNYNELVSEKGSTPLSWVGTAYKAGLAFPLLIILSGSLETILWYIIARYGINGETLAAIASLSALTGYLFFFLSAVSVFVLMGARRNARKKSLSKN